MTLKVISGPSVEPILAALAKLHTRVDSSTEDDLIDLWIKSGRELAEKFQNRAFIQQTLELTMDNWPASPFYVPRPPLIDVVSFRYYDTDNNHFDFTDYITDSDSEPGRIALAYNKTWSSITLRPINGIKIQFRAGYGTTADDVPQYVKDALLVYVNYRYENRESEFDDAPQQFYNLLWPDRVVPV